MVTRRIVDTVRGIGDADELADALIAMDHLPGHVVYVKLPDGAIVFGYDIEEETLSDGSIVYNLLLRAK
jgi:hypothetical protein